jgi:hypothetical protein
MAIILIVSGAGAAAGSTLSDDIVGESATTVEQAVIVPADEFSSNNVTASKSVVSVREQGTQFTVGSQAFQGETVDIRLPINSSSDERLTVELILEQVSGPEKLSINARTTGEDEFGDGDQISPIVQVSETEFRFQIEPTSADRIVIETHIEADSEPGFYEVDGTIKISDNAK